MKTVSLSGSPRENVGKKDAAELRRQGKVPAVLYGGSEQSHFSINEIDAKKLVFTPNVYKVEFDVDGKKVRAILKDVQIHPVTDRILHMDFMVSSSISNKVDLCTTVWDGRNPLTANVEYIPRHIELEEGDTVITSGFGGIFPRGVLIGIIESQSIDENEAFHEVNIDLTTDFDKLSFVQVVQNKLKVEKDSLELNIELP